VRARGRVTENGDIASSSSEEKKMRVATSSRTRDGLAVKANGIIPEDERG
jgi:hypothetical protein